jgi:hypothetical protein
VPAPDWQPKRRDEIYAFDGLRKVRVVAALLAIRVEPIQGRN